MIFCFVPQSSYHFKPLSWGPWLIFLSSHDVETWNQFVENCLKEAPLHLLDVNRYSYDDLLLVNQSLFCLPYTFCISIDFTKFNHRTINYHLLSGYSFRPGWWSLVTTYDFAYKAVFSILLNILEGRDKILLSSGFLQCFKVFVHIFACFLYIVVVQLLSCHQLF